MQRLTNPDDIEDARHSIAELLDGRGEWFCTTKKDGEPFGLRRGEWELSVSHGALFFSLPSETGVCVWRVSGWDWTGTKLCLEATRRTGAERATLELVPRASAHATGALTRAARQAACERLAALAARAFGGANIETARLSAGARRGEPGRFARIVLRNFQGRIAVAAPVVELRAGDADAFLASSLLWLARLGERGAGKPPTRLCLVATRSLCEATVERVALLRDEWVSALVVYELDGSWETLEQVRVPALEELLSVAARFRRTAKFATSETAARISSLAPEAIDVVRARHGETLRFHGLAFARVRRVMNREHAWFGVGGNAQRELLDESNWTKLTALVRELVAHRSAQTTNRHHALYKLAPEAWLESLLRRDITRLDPGLRLSPLHAQFQTSREPHAGARPVDLLALRRDGRLVVIELKVSEDAALAFQAADYWRRVEAQRRRGHLTRARLFDDATIEDAPPLVYAVAPLLRFHRAFNTLARTITPAIESYRFDINEDWRAGVRVVRRCDFNQ